MHVWLWCAFVCELSWSSETGCTYSHPRVRDASVRAQANRNRGGMRGRKRREGETRMQTLIHTDTCNSHTHRHLKRQTQRQKDQGLSCRVSSLSLSLSLSLSRLILVSVSVSISPPFPRMITHTHTHTQDQGLSCRVPSIIPRIIRSLCSGDRSKCLAPPVTEIRTSGRGSFQTLSTKYRIKCTLAKFSHLPGSAGTRRMWALVFLNVLFLIGKLTQRRALS